MKKLLLIALVAAGFAFGWAPKSNAGVSVGIGFGYPVGYGYPYSYYGSGYPYYGYYRPYRYGYVGPSFYWSNGHRVYYRHHRSYRHWR